MIVGFLDMVDKVDCDFLVIGCMLGRTEVVLVIVKDINFGGWLLASLLALVVLGVVVITSSVVESTFTSSSRHVDFS
jgi:hypothetical protein